MAGPLTNGFTHNGMIWISRLDTWTITAPAMAATVSTGPNARQMAHYTLRWKLSDGTNGPWSETISATITG